MPVTTETAMAWNTGCTLSGELAITFRVGSGGLPFDRLFEFAG
jgi:hypothetical protein